MTEPIIVAFKDKQKELSYIAQYQKDNYDRITVMSPKGTKEQLKAAATLKPAFSKPRLIPPQPQNK